MADYTDDADNYAGPEYVEEDAEAGYQSGIEPREDDTQAKVSMDKLLAFADAQGDVSQLLTESELTSLGADVVVDYDYDYQSNNVWRDKVKRALDAAAQDTTETKDYPFPSSSNVKYPTLTVAAQQFAARAYPAIVKGDVAVGVKVLGKKPDNAPAPQAQQNALGQETGEAQQVNPAVQAYEAKKARAERVKDFLNYRIFYGMNDWEGDIDIMLNQLPIIGMAFKKVYKSPKYGVCSEYVPALSLTVHCDTRSLDDCPRITQEYTLYPYQIMNKIKTGEFIDVSEQLVSETEDDQAPRTILEQHRLHDLDGDGIEEPYIIVVDKESQAVLRIEAAYGRADVLQQNGQIVGFIRWNPFIAFPFMPDPKGRFYGIGFGALLDHITEAANSSINQLIDAGHAQNAGGGFIASGLRIQGGGQTSTLRFKPGEYKTVNSPAGELRAQIYERTIPQPSAVLFQMLGLLLDAAKDVSSVKDVLTGDAPNNAPVGTTMALIEQGLQGFTAIYKRFYRALKYEFKLIYECEGKWGGKEAAEAYTEFFDGDPEADFTKDFTTKGYDIVPVSDPTVVTKAQQLAKAQFMQQFIPLPFMNGPEIVKRSLEAASIDDVDDLFAPQAQPNPMQIAELEKTKSEANKNNAAALKSAADAGEKTGEHETNGAINAGVHAEQGGFPNLGEQSNDAMDIPGGVQGGAAPAAGVPEPDMGLNA